MFINDDWKLSSRLTVSAGLRYDIFQPLTERDNLASNFFPDRGLVQVGKGLDSLYKTDRNNLGPRAGLAWDVTGDGKTSVRVGYALTYDVPQFGTIHSPAQSRPGSFTNPDLDVFSVTLTGATSRLPDDPAATCVDPNNSGRGGDFICAQPGVSIYGSNPNGAPPFNVFAVPTNLQAPMYHYLHASFQRELARNNAVTISYVGSRGVDLILGRDINGSPLGSSFATPDRNRPFAAAFPNLRHIISLTNDGRSWYDSMQLSYRQNNWHGINTQYNYTLAKSTDYGSSNRAGVQDFPAQNNPYNPAANKGPSGFDVRHNFNVGGTYGIPHSSFLGGLGNDVQFGTVFTALTGRPFTARIGTRDRTGQDTGWSRADCLAAPIYDYSNPDKFITNVATAFGTPANGLLGSCGRNSLRRPGIAQWDLNVIKTFSAGSSARIQARWEIFNLLNRVNAGNVQTTNVRSNLFGSIGSTPDVDAGNPVIAQGGPRAMQWSVKVLF
jgi:hypothetical protein